MMVASRFESTKPAAGCSTLTPAVLGLRLCRGASNASRQLRLRTGAGRRTSRTGLTILWQRR